MTEMGSNLWTNRVILGTSTLAIIIGIRLLSGSSTEGSCPVEGQGYHSYHSNYMVIMVTMVVIITMITLIGREG